MSVETKSWLTPKRLARGPEAANEELRRWSKERRRRKLVAEMRGTFRPAQIYGDAAAMRRDALASRAERVGSTVMARDADSLGAVDLLVGVSAIAVGVLIGRWWVRRSRAPHPPVAVRGAAGDSAYARGALALAAR